MGEDLREEIAFFEANKPRLLADHREKFVLIKGSELAGTFDTAERAYVAGLERFGNVPFLIKQVLEDEPAVHLPALSLGLLRAHP